MKNEILTTKLTNGVQVLAKNTKYGVNPYTFVNYKQAENKMNQLTEMGISSTIYDRGVVKFIRL